MGTYSVNQSRQVYVCNNVTSTSAVGGVLAKLFDSGKFLYFEHHGMGGMTRSDLIPRNSILSTKLSTAASMNTKLQRQKIILDASVNSGAPIANQEYILGVQFNQFMSLSENSQYFKWASVKATTGMTASTFYHKLLKSFLDSFQKEESGMIKCYLETLGTGVSTAGTLVEITKDTLESAYPDKCTGIVLEEAEEDWEFGIQDSRVLPFYITSEPVTFNGDEFNWCSTAYVTPVSLRDGVKQIANLEYFLMGERGDQYRNVGFPYVIPTKYMVDISKEYDIIDIHYYFSDSNEGAQKSEKTITLIVLKNASNLSTALYTQIQKFITDGTLA